MKLPLEGIRVIDITAFGAAPLAGAFLGGCKQLTAVNFQIHV
jgi:crotonobetainyl-CoA:carnitine CoA-transferase CaiB-like acyl-CoA transferase